MNVSPFPQLRVAAALPARAGVGFKPEHFDDIRQARPDIGFFEVHAENYMGDGGPPHRRLEALRADYPLSLHGVGLSIGSPRPLDREHLRRLAALVKRYEPGLFSEHLAWSSHDQGYFNDLLPLPLTTETLACVSAHVAETQDALGRRILIENPSTYLLFSGSDIPEPDFLRELSSRTGCGLLLDVNNVVVSSVNHGFDRYAYLDAFPLEKVGEIHLAGFAEAEDEAGARLLIDAHDSAVRAEVWSLYQRAIAARGPTPTLIEWDNDVPCWAELFAEARHADELVADALAAYERGAAMRFEAAIADFAEAIVDPAAPIPQFTLGRGEVPDRKRFAVYRNNVAIGLLQALEARFPVTRRLVGDEFFRAMARAFVLAHKPRTPVLIHYGREFPGFVKTFAPAREVPYLGEVARLEDAWVDAYHAAEASPLTRTDLASVAAERVEGLTFVFHPAARLLSFDYPAASIWAAHQGETSPRGPVEWRPEQALITRPHANVCVRVLPAGGFAFASALSAGARLADAAAPLTAECLDPLAHLVGLVEAGAIAAVN